MTTNKTSTMIATLALALAGSAFAADTTDHDAHHPQGATAAAKAPAVKAQTSKANAAAPNMAPAMAMMDTKIQSMHAMHEKMMAAKTPEARNALMGEHMKTMQNVMATMGDMGMMGAMGGKGGMGMNGGMQGKDTGAMKDNMPADMAMRQQMMEKRMEMMESMMQMMVDRMPSVPATK
jgi:hypothetical protein